ncbi:MAG: DUF2029 domain-containing protein [Planctomycetia bacterium]|nr:DUF2029 domain-containing protein [Planctomycetia bacterium]
MTTLIRWMNQPFYGLSWSIRNVFLTVLAILSLIFLFCILYFNATATPSLNSALSAGWAVRADQNIYHVSDDHGEVFHGAPLVAILLSPLGQPPAQSSTEGILPRPIALFLLLLLLATALCLTLHRLACYLESQQEASPTTFTWWHHRLTPMLLCAGPIYASLSQFQSDAIMLFLLTGWLLAAVGHRSFQSGCWLAGAIAIKLFPVYLLILAIYRRDRLMTLGTALGLALSLILLPSIFFGFQRTSRLNEHYFKSIEQPLQHIATSSTNASLSAGLLRTLGNSGSPHYFSFSHLGMIGLLTAITLLSWRTVRPSSLQLFQTGCSLLIILVMASPVYELHHALLFLPAMMISLMNVTPWRLLGLLLTSSGLLLSLVVNQPGTASIPLASALLLWGMQIWSVRTLHRQVQSTDLPQQTIPLARAA